MTKRYPGSCLCGQVTFDATGFSNEVAACHCTMCRKFHGAAFGTLVEVEGLRWNSGKELLKDYQGSNGTVRTSAVTVAQVWRSVPVVPNKINQSLQSRALTRTYR